MNHGEYLTPYPLRIWDVMIDYDFDIDHFQGDGYGLLELYGIFWNIHRDSNTQFSKSLNTCASSSASSLQLQSIWEPR